MNFWWYALIAYVVSVPFTFRFWFRNMASSYGDDTWGDILFCCFIALYITSFSAPLIPICLAVQKIFFFFVKDITPAQAKRFIAGESKEDKIDRLEMEARAREYKIARMEKELLGA